MIDRVAVLSDIHGVLPALDAVLAEPDVAAADRVVLTGDLAAGPLPAQTLDRLAALGDRAVWVRGNADRELVQLAGGGDTKIPDPIVPWAAETVVCGHTHMPFTRLVDRRLVVNPGSVGMPYGSVGAHWALLGGASGGVQLRRTPYDAEAACQSLVDASAYPASKVWAQDFVRNPASDTEALAVFGATSATR